MFQLVSQVLIYYSRNTVETVLQLFYKTTEKMGWLKGTNARFLCLELVYLIFSIKKINKIS